MLSDPQKVTFLDSESFLWDGLRHHILFTSQPDDGTGHQMYWNVWLTSKAGKTYCVFSSDGDGTVKFEGERFQLDRAGVLADLAVERIVQQNTNTEN